MSSDGNLQAGSPSDVKPELNIYTGRRLSAVAWNSDGSRIATGSDDGQVHIWASEGAKRQHSTSAAVEHASEARELRSLTTR